jgi:hypothetical protein
MDLVRSDEVQSLGKRYTVDLDMLVGLGLRDAFSDVPGEIDLHPFAEEARTGEVSGEQGPALGAESGLFNHLSFGSGQRSFAGLDAASRKFDQEATGSVTVLTFQNDVGIFRVLRVVDGENNDRAIVADDIAGVAVATGLENGIGIDVEDLTFICKLRREQLCLEGGFWFAKVFRGDDGRGGDGFFGGDGFMRCGGHEATVSSASKRRRVASNELHPLRNDENPSVFAAVALVA